MGIRGYAKIAKLALKDKVLILNIDQHRRSHGSFWPIPSCGQKQTYAPPPWIDAILNQVVHISNTRDLAGRVLALSFCNEASGSQWHQCASRFFKSRYRFSYLFIGWTPWEIWWNIEIWVQSFQNLWEILKDGFVCKIRGTLKSDEVNHPFMISKWLWIGQYVPHFSFPQPFVKEIFGRTINGIFNPIYIYYCQFPVIDGIWLVVWNIFYFPIYWE